MLERPAGRSTLLDPASRQIAVGPSLPEGVPAVAAAVTTYSLFETRDHSREEQRVLTAIDRARARQGTGAPPLTRITGIPALEAQARLVLDKGRGPMDALQTVLDEASARSGKRVQGYVLETNDLDHFDVPPELLGKGALQLGIAVTHHKAEGAAWGQFVLFLVVIDPEVSVRGASASEI